MGLVVAPDFFMLDGAEWWERDPAFYLMPASPDDTERLADAVAAAAARMLLVTDTGAVVDDYETDDGSQGYTPNFVSDVYAMERGLYLWADTKGELDARMASTMLRVLEEELDRAGVSCLLADPPREFRADDPVVRPFPG